MVASRTDVEVRFQRSPCEDLGATGTLQGSGDGDFTSQHDFPSPWYRPYSEANERKMTLRLSQVRAQSLDEKLAPVITKSGRRPGGAELAGRSNKQGKDLADEVESKLLREEGRMWVFIRPRGGQDCYLLTGEIRGWTELCPIHRFDGLDQIPVCRTRMELRLVERTEGRIIACH
jgi:hypothetical protein